ncbi:MAG: acyltransferase, partial [Verrucomicrobiota bacterium]|nr:acyltransferase [Verrucomicrobiota bacterium]
YSFWTEPRPEILISFGEPLVPRDAPVRTVAEWTQVFSDALRTAQDDLAARSCRRDGEEWLSVDRGQSGVNRIYDAWRWLRGEKFASEHFSEVLQ